MVDLFREKKKKKKSGYTLLLRVVQSKGTEPSNSQKL
jgi:hypothetical protein